MNPFSSLMICSNDSFIAVFPCRGRQAVVKKLPTKDTSLPSLQTINSFSEELAVETNFYMIDS